MTRTAHECSWAERTVLLTLHALEPEQEAAVAGHVSTCATCRVTQREAEETFAAIGETAAVPPPPELRHRIAAAARQETGPGRRDPRRWAVAAAAAVLVAGLGGAGFVVAQLDSQRDGAVVHAGTVEDKLAAITTSPHAVLVDRDRRPVAAVALRDAPRFYDLDLPSPPAGRVWVLWGARGQAATALAALPGGPGDVSGAVPVGRPGEFEAYLITQEAAGPLPTRRGEVWASGPVTAAGS